MSRSDILVQTQFKNFKIVWTFYGGLTHLTLPLWWRQWKTYFRCSPGELAWQAGLASGSVGGPNKRRAFLLPLHSVRRCHPSRQCSLSTQRYSSIITYYSLLWLHCQLDDAPAARRGEPVNGKAAGSTVSNSVQPNSLIILWQRCRRHFWVPIYRVQNRPIAKLRTLVQVRLSPADDHVVCWCPAALMATEQSRLLYMCIPKSFVSYTLLLTLLCRKLPIFSREKPQRITLKWNTVTVLCYPVNTSFQKKWTTTCCLEHVPCMALYRGGKFSTSLGENSLLSRSKRNQHQHVSNYFATSAQRYWSFVSSVKKFPIKSLYALKWYTAKQRANVEAGSIGVTAIQAVTSRPCKAKPPASLE